MAEFDHGIKIIARKSGRQLARLAGVECRSWEPLESTLQATTEFLADRAFLARQGRQRFVVYFEFYTIWNRNAPWDMLAKAGLLSQREQLPTVCLVFVFLPRGYRQQHGKFRLEAAGGPTQQLWFREICLWQLQPQSWWQEVPGLMTLYPLCRHRRRPPEAIRLAADAIERAVSDPGERGDDLFLLNIFGGLAYPRLDVAGIIGREKMKESRYSRELREEASQETRRADIFDALEARFGAQSKADVETAVNSVTNLDELRRLHRLATICADFNEFRASLPRQRAAR